MYDRPTFLDRHPGYGHGWLNVASDEFRPSVQEVETTDLRNWELNGIGEQRNKESDDQTW